MEKIFNTLAVPFGYVMRACYWFTGLFGGDGSYVVSILLFALLMQILLCPFGIIQQKNSQKQAKMRPMEYLIRKKYAGRTDRATQQKMQNEIMELYQKEGYNPVSGCLPMLLQLVIILPLYYVVVNPLQHIAGFSSEAIKTITLCFEHAGQGIGDGKSSGKEVILASKIFKLHGEGKLGEVIKDYDAVMEGETVKIAEAKGAEIASRLESIFAGEGGFNFIPKVNFLGFDLGTTPKDIFNGGFKFTAILLLILIPVINLGLMYLSQIISRKLNPQPMQQENGDNQAGAGMLNSMKIMMWTMPLMTFFFTFMFPAAIGIYWIFRTLLSMLQQFILSKAIKLPKYTEEDLKRIEKEMREARKKAGKPDIVYNEGAPKPYKSLHHIDDDE